MWQIWNPLTNVNFVFWRNTAPFNFLFFSTPYNFFLISLPQTSPSHSTPTYRSPSSPSSSSCCDLPGDSWWIRESGRHRASTQSRPVNMHANVALDISTTVRAGRGKRGIRWRGGGAEGGGLVRGETLVRGKIKLIETERTEIRMDSIMPLCVIPSLRVETSIAGPLATWEQSLEGWVRGLNIMVYRENRHSVYQIDITNLYLQ